MFPVAEQEALLDSTGQTTRLYGVRGKLQELLRSSVSIGEVHRLGSVRAPKGSVGALARTVSQLIVFTASMLVEFVITMEYI